ncbi:MAG: steroid-24-oyl-CoA synthetase [Actinomycetota bacterium]|jgi:long-chain acyl-CoA synthetase|nr:steroid-24-oyl-CoA synthetase [Actinomycetota bacterium]
MTRRTGPVRAHWSADVVTGTVRGHPSRLFEARPRWLGEVLLESTRWSDRDHLIQGEQRVSHEGLLGWAAGVAGSLRSAGVGRGDRVALYGANRPEWVAGFWGALLAGAVVVPFNAWWSGPEVAHALATSSAAVVLTDGPWADRLPAGTATLPLTALSDTGGGAGLLAFDWDDVPAEDEPAVILFTSGTTGLPKGATLSHRSVIANLQNLLTVSGRLPGQLPDDHVGATNLLTVPLFHQGGIQILVMAPAVGGRLVFSRGRFDAGEVLRLIEAERVTAWGAVPTMVQRVVDHPDVDRYDCSSLRALVLGGAPAPPELLARARRAFPSAVRGVGNMYGLTEAGGAVTSSVGVEVERRPGTTGRPLAVVEVRIDDPDGSGAGEILVRTPAAMEGYWGMDASPIDSDGWLRTGDIGRLDADGYLYVVDRSKDLIIRGGENIAGSHVEAVLVEHPAVVEVAVVGLPHPDLGEEVGAVVVCHPDRPVTPDELRTFAAGRLAHFEVPSAWLFRTEAFPLNAVGKVLKRELRAQWSAERADGRR